VGFALAYFENAKINMAECVNTPPLRKCENTKFDVAGSEKTPHHIEKIKVGLAELVNTPCHVGNAKIDVIECVYTLCHSKTRKLTWQGV
jgi:hypothetical protein